MGKAQSTQSKQGKSATLTRPADPGVKMRSKRASAPSMMSDRPLSDPCVSLVPDGGVAPSMNPAPVQPADYPTTTNFRSVSMDLSGRFPAGIAGQEVVKVNPLLDEVDTSTVKVEHPTAPEKFTHSVATVQAYERAISQVVLIWPDFETLKKLDPASMDSALLRTVDDVCRRLAEQYHNIRSLFDEAHDAKRSLSELQEECTAKEQALKRSEADVEVLRERVASLRDELRRRSIDQQRIAVVDGKDALHTPPIITNGDGSPRGSPDGALPPRTDGGSPSSRQRTLDSGSGTMDSQESKLRIRRLEKDRIYRPTPLLQAEGEEQRTKLVAVQRSQSLKPVELMTSSMTYPSEKYDVSATSLALEGTSDDKIRQLETAWEKERKENNLLRERLKFKETSDREILYEMVPRHSLSRDSMLTRYQRLEDYAVGKLYSIVKRQLTTIKDHRRSQFICAVMETTYSTALLTVVRFKDIVERLIANPTRLDFGGPPSSTLSHKVSVCRSSYTTSINNTIDAIKDNVKKFESSSQDSLTRRPLANGELPDVLVKQMMTYLENTSDVINLTPLVEMVTDSLRSSFPDCSTASLLNQAEFTQFLQDCARLAWQMTVRDPPLYVATDSWRMDDRVHETLMQEPVTNAQVDHYLWPVLYERKNGSVLNKGRVVLQLV